MQTIYTTASMLRVTVASGSRPAKHVRGRTAGPIVCLANKQETNANAARSAGATLLAAAFVAGQVLLVGGPAAATVKTTLRGIAPDVASPTARAKLFEQRLCETEEEIGYPRASLYNNTKDFTVDFLTMPDIKARASTASVVKEAAKGSGVGMLPRQTTTANKRN